MRPRVLATARLGGRGADDASAGGTRLAWRTSPRSTEPNRQPVFMKSLMYKGPPTITISKSSQVKYWKCHLGQDGIRPGLDIPVQKGGHQVAPDWQPRTGTALTCGDGQVRPHFCSRGCFVAPSIRIGRPDHSANLLETSV